MKIAIESTTQVVTLNGVPARIWQGHTESGIPVHCFVTRIAIPTDADSSQFDRELQEHAAPRPELEAYPLRMIL